MAMKTYSTRITVGLLFIFLLSSCAQTSTLDDSIGVLSASAVAAPISLEQKTGYETGLTNAVFKFNPLEINETAPSSDTQRTIRSLVEDTDTPILALMGATSNDATARAASLVNFFNLPMVVPSANGDNIFPSNNLWAFRLSASGADYANYLFGSVLTRANAGSDAQTEIPFPGLRIAILYEETTFGESAAVATAQAAMLQMINIGLYANFPANSPDINRLGTIIEQIKEKNIQVVYLISNNPTSAATLVQAIRTSVTGNAAPLIVGQAGGFASRDFLASKTAEGVFVLRQQLFANECPAGIDTLYQAQSYAAVVLLDRAIQEAQSNQPEPSPWYNFRPPTQVLDVNYYREKIRDILKESTFELPCMGKTAFDNFGQNKMQHLEIISVSQGKVITDQLDSFKLALGRRIALDLFSN